MIYDFTFCVLCFNHSSYVLEHLESIKYQVVNYGADIKCNLIISDDSSKDDSVELIKKWLVVNSSIFNEVLTIFNSKNVGTCQSLKNIVANLETEHCKITASDDVYTQINIFEFINNHSGYSLVSALPIRLIDGKVKVSFLEVFNFIASDDIYKKKALIDRLSSLSIVNAPNLFYSMRYLKDPKVMGFLEDYDVVEDLPLQVSIALQDPASILVSSHTPLVLYRRTSGSTYMVSSSKFSKDQLNIFDYLIGWHLKNGNRFKVLLLLNRKFLFRSRCKFCKWIFNLSKYKYALSVLWYLPRIIRKYRSIKVNLAVYQNFYDSLKELSA